MPDPSGVTGVAEFLDHLIDLRRWAGQPSLRRLRHAAVPDACGHSSLAPSTVSAVLATNRLPRLPFVEAFVAGCLVVSGCSAAEVETHLPAWIEAWRRLARTEDVRTTPVPASAPPPGDLDPLAATSVAEFMARLRLLRTWAGNPSLSTLRKRTGVARSTLYDAFAANRTRLPALDLIRRIVAACDRPPADVARWEAAWRALESHENAVQAAGVSARATPIPRQLPAGAGGFVGRTEELAWLDSADGRLVVVSGQAGAGKTAR